MTLIGGLNFFFPTEGEACLVPSPRRLNVSVDCQPGTTSFWHAVIGFSSDGSPPCVVGECWEPVSVEPRSWGAIKGMYR